MPSSNRRPCFLASLPALDSFFHISTFVFCVLMSIYIYLIIKEPGHFNYILIYFLLLFFKLSDLFVHLHKLLNVFDYSEFIFFSF